MALFLHRAVHLTAALLEELFSILKSSLPSIQEHQE
jgi:hypothetical protein